MKNDKGTSKRSGVIKKNGIGVEPSPSKRQISEEAIQKIEDLKNSLPKPEQMTESAVKKARKLLLDTAKELDTYPRSPWHRAFEQILHIDVDSWATIQREFEVMGNSPRIDFLILKTTQLPENRKGIFKIFRKANIVEYKRPGDLITERKIRKNIGYANLLIGTTGEKEYQVNQLTITLFGDSFNEKNKQLMLKKGILTESEIKGVYTVNVLTDYPYQVIVRDELTDGSKDDYALYRVLSDHADEDDVQKVLDEMKKASVDEQDHFRNVLNLVENKNQGKVAELIREDNTMKDVFYEVLGPQIEERVRNEVRNEVKKEHEAELANLRADLEEKHKAELADRDAENAELRVKHEADVDNVCISMLKEMMKNLHMDAWQAMEKTNVPKIKREHYAAALST